MRRTIFPCCPLQQRQTASEVPITPAQDAKNQAVHYCEARRMTAYLTRLRLRPDARGD